MGSHLRLRYTRSPYLFALISSLGLCAVALFAQSSRQSKGWISLFDGKTFDHWNDPRKMNPPGDAWSIEDGAFKTKKHPNITEDLVSTEGYSDFELVWEWKISEGGNSGVKYRVQAFPVLPASEGAGQKFESRVDAALKANAFDRSIIASDKKAQIYVVGFEYQMIDNSRHPDAKRGALYQSGALYSITPPLKDATKPVGEWNESRLVVRGNHFEHWLNGKQVVSVDATPDLLNHALEKRWGAGSETLRLLSDQPKTQCPITLQNHGDEAWFRAIKIRQI